MPRLSVIIIALNQEANIGDCLASVSFADDIVVVDTGSTDRTVELARAYTDRVLSAPWQGFGRTKNYALDQARGEWVFSLDTDERVPPALQEEILAVVASDGPLDGYRVARKNYFCGRWIRHLGWYPDYTLRLFRRGRGRFRDREVHEEVVVDGPVGTLKTPLEHYQLPERQRIRRPHGPVRPPGGPGIGQGGAAPLTGRIILQALFLLFPSLFYPAGVSGGDAGIYPGGAYEHVQVSEILLSPGA